jgi:hypothetical protein
MEIDILLLLDFQIANYNLGHYIEHASLVLKEESPCE